MLCVFFLFISLVSSHLGSLCVCVRHVRGLCLLFNFLLAFFAGISFFLFLFLSIARNVLPKKKHTKFLVCSHNLMGSLAECVHFCCFLPFELRSMSIVLCLHSNFVRRCQCPDGERGNKERERKTGANNNN